MPQGKQPSKSIIAAGRPEKRRRRKASIESQAQRGAIRVATPLQVEQMLADLEASGDIEPDEDIIGDDVALDELMSEMDADLDLNDEDQPSAEDWGDDGEVLANGDEDTDPGISPFAPRRFEIVVTDGVCSVAVDEKCIQKRARTPRGEQVLYELETRIWAFRRIAAWLTERRGDFLRIRNLWHLGCEALDDIKQGRTPVEQKSFLHCAGLKPRVSEESLSGYIRATDIAWKDGSAPLDILFSDDAKRAWVANAVRQFIEEGGAQVTAALLERMGNIKVQRSQKRPLAQRDPDAMDLPTFIRKANVLAGTQWAEVISQYGNRMVRCDNGS